MRPLRLLAVGAMGLLATIGSAFASPPPLVITTLSTGADRVSGGDVLVRVGVPAGVSLSNVHVTLNGQDVTGLFLPDAASQGLVGLVTGLRDGDNVLRATTKNTNPSLSARLDVTNFPITGPIISGPHETPFFCMTQNFPAPGSATERLGSALDANCSTATRVDYVYRSTGANPSFKALPKPAAYPADLAQTRTTDGKLVRYIVRVETGTINRAIYQTAVLHDPIAEAAPTPFSPPAAWNHRLVYTLGGGCTGGWYIQGSSIGNGGILEDLMLRQGYGVASSTLNVFGNNCNELLAAESLMMVKERFIENFGPVAFTIGYGCSGGSEQAHPISDGYPGLLDGIIVGCSFPEVTAAMVLNVTDADLLLHYLQRTGLTWSDAQIVATSGYPTVTTVASIGPGNAVRTKAQGGTCNAAVPVSIRYDAVTNPTGVRCDLYDHMVNVFGRDDNGFARRPIDNVGVQYGLGALNSGAITVPMFLDLNRNIGGYDGDGNYVSTRTLGDKEALGLAYRAGRVTYGGLGLRSTPIIDYRGYVDQPENGGEVHSRFHSFSLRQRLLDANGNFDNQVMLVEDGRAGTTGLFGDSSPVLSHALTQMDQWLTSLTADASDAPVDVKMRRAKPSDLVDACFTQNGTVKIAEPQVYQGATACNQLYPSFSTPRMVAGGPLANNILKCRLKSIDSSDYNVTFTSAEKKQLKEIFGKGVCDFSQPGVGQEPTEATWEFF